MVDGYGNPHTLRQYNKACDVVSNIRLDDIVAGAYKGKALKAVSTCTQSHSHTQPHTHTRARALEHF